MKKRYTFNKAICPKLFEMRHLMFVSLALILVSCSKDENPNIPETDKFSWTYNGLTYNYLISNDHTVNAGAGKGQNGNASIIFDMSEALGGTIYFEKGCAYLEPLGSSISQNQGCLLTDKDDAGHIIPIDSTKVFIYQSGSFNINFSNCTKKTGVDFVTGISYQYDVCAVSGSFDLTLVNKDNTTIKISDGIVDLHHVILN